MEHPFRLRKTLGPLGGPVSSVTLIGRSPLRVAAAVDGNILIIDVKAGQIQERLSAVHSQPIICLASDSEVLVASARDGVLSVWDVSQPTITKPIIRMRVLSDRQDADLLSCAVVPKTAKRGQRLLVSGDNAVMCVSMDKLTHQLAKMRASPTKEIGLSPVFATCHFLHSQRVTCIAPSRSGRYLCSASEDETFVVATISEMRPFGSNCDADDDEEEMEEENLLVGSVTVGDGIRSFKLVGQRGDIALVGTDTEKLALYRIPCLSNATVSEKETRIELLSPTPIIREHPSLQTGQMMGGAIVATLFDPFSSSGEGYVVGSSAEGKLVLYGVGEGGIDTVRVAAEFFVPGEEVGHKDLVRDAEFCGINTIITTGDDGRICFWSQDHSNPDESRNSRYNPY